MVTGVLVHWEHLAIQFWLRNFRKSRWHSPTFSLILSIWSLWYIMPWLFLILGRWICSFLHLICFLFFGQSISYPLLRFLPHAMDYWKKYLHCYWESFFRYIWEKNPEPIWPRCRIWFNLIGNLYILLFCYVAVDSFCIFSYTVNVFSSICLFILFYHKL